MRKKNERWDFAEIIYGQKSSSQELPFVPRLTFYDPNGIPHIVCGNGAHFIWARVEDAWMWKEEQPLPGSARNEQKNREESAKRLEERQRQEEQAERDRSLQWQETRAAEVARDRSMTFQEIVLEELDRGVNTSGRLFATIAARSHSRWSRRDAERELAEMVSSGIVVEKILRNSANVSRREYYRAVPP